MTKLFAFFAIVLTVVAVSGCYCVGTHVSDVQGGKKTTSGLLSFDAIDNGYPMIPFYSKFEAGE
jgi:uncharacterized protein YceK